MEAIANFIGGRMRPPASGQYLENLEPATGRAYSQVPDSGQPDVAQAVEAARAAFPGWAATPARERSRILLRLAELVEQNLDSLARAESIDSGKPISLARSVEIPRAAENLSFFATAILHTQTEAHDTGEGGGAPGQGGAAINYTLRRPRGVAGLISPWNLPLYLFTWKIAPALATGNTAVAKPSELTPMTAFMLAKLANEAGLPPGVLNIVHGTGASCGAEIVRHPDVPTISFTGSTATGRWIAETAGPMFKRLSLELGGKNPFIIFADADLPRAIAAAVRAAFTNQGQICLCGSRLLVQRQVYQEVLNAVVKAAQAMTPGDPLDPATTFGSLISRQHQDKVASYVQLARDLSGTIHCGGAPPTPSALPERVRGGAYFLPTVISGLDPACRVEQEEIFGPVVTLRAFDDDEEAVALANSTPYGLAATLWTLSATRAHRIAARLDAGIIWVNCWLLRDLRTPFGGMKQSGVGREGGVEAIRFFAEAKNVCVGL
jgi:aminomuconate-semialdehyde/2-hydroxymuconate-6-semialdehyde dehydrogenase